MTNNNEIRFLAHCVKKGSLKVRCRYSMGEVWSIDSQGKRITVEAVTIYAKDYEHDMAEIFSGFLYENNTDTMTDYFEKGRVCLKKGHPLYQSALKRAGINSAKSAERRERREAKRA